MMPKPYRPLTTPELLALIDDMIELTDRHGNRPWEVPSGSVPLNVFFVHASVQHVVNLSRGILTLYRAGQEWEAVPLVRTALEFAATAAWYAVAPEQTGGVVFSGAKERRQLLRAVAQFGIDTSEASAEAQEMVEQYLPDQSDAADRFLERTREITGGDTFYTSYRAISRFVHPGVDLTDYYLAPDDSPENLYHMALLNEAAFDDTEAHGWLGHHACMMVVALRAAESMLVKPRHSTQIERWAKKLGGFDKVEFIAKAQVKEQTMTSFMQSIEGRIAKRGWDADEAAAALRKLADQLQKGKA